MIRQWIDSAAAHWGGAAYLQDAGGAGQLTFAGLQHATRAWARCLDRAGLPPGARVAVRLADPVEYACALVAIIGAGRVVVPLDPAAPAAALATVLDVARPEAIVAHGSSGLPRGPVRCSRRRDRDARNGPPGWHRPDPADGRDFPVHQRHQRHAQGGPAARQPAVPRGRVRGYPTPADPGRPRLLLPPAVPRQRRGGGAAGHPGRAGLPGAGPQVQPPRILGHDRGAGDHLDQRRSRDHHHPGHGAGRRPGGRTASASSAPPRPRWHRRRYAASSRPSASPSSRPTG